MPLLIHCANCLRQLRIPDHAVENPIQCPACQEIFQPKPQTAARGPGESNGAGRLPPEDPYESQGFSDRSPGSGSPWGEKSAAFPRERSEKFFLPCQPSLRQPNSSSAQGPLVILSILGGLLLAVALALIGYFLAKGDPRKGGNNGPNQPGPRPAALGKEWGEFHSAGGHYWVRLPGKPMHMTQKQNVPPFGSMTMHMDVAPLPPNQGFLVLYAVFPASVGDASRFEAEFQKGVMQGMAKGGGRVRGSREVTWQGRRCQEIEIEAPGMGNMVIRGFLVGRRAYLLIAFGPGYTGATPEVAGFFQSFRMEK